jgi:hypothetical protein
MSLQDITIYRDFPIVNNFVQVPPNKETDKTRVTPAEALANISGATTERLSLGSGRPRGWKTGQQEWIRLPGITPGEWYATDPVDDVAGA